MRTVRSAARQVLFASAEALNGAKPGHWQATRLARAQRRSTIVPHQPSLENLVAAVDWIARAQDACGGNGVSWGYCARSGIGSTLETGWQPPYPETTGYIIETALRCSKLLNDPGLIQRARRMADWEISIQLPDGGTQGGMYASQPVAASTFVTGQVLFGLIAAYQEFKDRNYLEAAGRSADFLVSCLDGQDHFVRGYSEFCAAGPKAYEARTGWALAQFGEFTGCPQYSDAGSRLGQFAISCQTRNGWFDQNDLDFHDMPLTHTIGYVLEGLLGIDATLNQNRFTAAVFRTLDKVASLVGEDGFLAGRWSAEWKPLVNWSCLTGSAQLAIVLYRACRIRPERAWRDAADRLLGYVTSTQRCIGVPMLAGGIQGSYPLDGEYGRWCVLNWATKFYLDAILESGLIGQPAASFSHGR